MYMTMHGILFQGLKLVTHEDRNIKRTVTEVVPAIGVYSGSKVSIDMTWSILCHVEIESLKPSSCENSFTLEKPYHR